MFVRMTSNNTQNSKSSRIDVNESPIMNEDEMELFLNVKRSRSDQSMLGRLFSQQIEAQKPRPLIINIPIPTTTENNGNNNSSFKLFRKIKKQKKKNDSDYCKNICGYITKKIIRELCSPNYSNHVKGLCTKYNCDYKEIKSFYLPKIEQVTGPSHIPSLLVAQNQQQERIKQVFKQFFQWFIKYRYLRYLLIQGKMADKKAYIKYKNYMLLAMLNENKNGTNNSNSVILKQEPMSDQQESDSSLSDEDQIQKQQKQKNELDGCEKKGKNKKKAQTVKPVQSTKNNK